MASANTDTAESARPLFRPLATEYVASWKKFEFWRDSFLLFWIFSLTGHILEFGWAAIPLLFGQPSHIQTIPILAVAAPYGLGALALIWLVYPLVARGKIGLIWAYIISAVAATAVEFICAATVVLIFGSNPFWNYSDEPFNLFGFVCLRNSLAFGLAAIPMIYLVFPCVNNLMRKIKAQRLNLVFWPLFISYVAIQVWRIWLR